MRFRVSLCGVAAAALLALGASDLLAQDTIRFHFTFPSAFENDAPLERAAIQRTRVSCGPTPPGEPAATEPRYPLDFAADGAVDFIDAELAVGTWYCVGRIVANDMTSGYSNVLELIVTPAGPGQGVRPRAVTIFFQ